MIAKAISKINPDGMKKAQIVREADKLYASGGGKSNLKQTTHQAAFVIAALIQLDFIFYENGRVFLNDNYCLLDGCP